MSLLSEIERVVQESSRKLLQISVPPVRYWLLVDTLGKDERDPLLRRTIEECKTYPQRLKLLRSMREDGTWPISKVKKAREDAGPGPPVGWTSMTMLRNLQLLEDMITDKDEGHIHAALETILSWQQKDGYILGPYHDVFPMPSYNGYAIRDLLVYGLGNDPRVRKMAEWLLDMQRLDGGWIIPYLEDVKYLPEFRDMKMNDFMELVRRGEVPKSDPRGYRDIPSCIWTTMMVVRGLAEHETHRRRQAIKKGADFFLDRFFKNNWHQAYRRSDRNWMRLTYPIYPGNGLYALYLLTKLGYGPSDPRMDKPIRWLLSARHSDGFWWQSDRAYAQKDQWITGFAVDVLNRYAKNK